MIEGKIDAFQVAAAPRSEGFEEEKQTGS